MQKYLLRRLLLIIPTLIGMSMLIFAMVRFMPGDVVDQILGEDITYVTPETRASIERRYGLDRPIYEQYVVWMGDTLQGDLGRSIISGREIRAEIAERMPVTIQLGVMAIIVAVLVAVPVGVIAAVKQDSFIDYFTRSTAIVFLAAPNFWLALIAITYGYTLLGWTPPIRYAEIWNDPATNLRMLWVPALILGSHMGAKLMRYTRGTMLEVLRQDYIRTAWAKGLRGQIVVLRHGLRNAVIPIITVIGLEIPLLVGGTVVLERIFSIPGMGNFLLSSINSRDYPVVQAIVLVIALVVVLANLIVDILYAVIDPRIRYS
jgi:peptide/nickel transport system permease protein